MKRQMGLHARISRWRRKAGSFWSFLVGTLFLFLVFVTGVCGYMWIEGWSIVDSFYMVVITLSTVGYSEIHVMSAAGRMFTTFLILGGVGGFLFLTALFAQMMVEGRIQILLGRHRMHKIMKKLNDHFIVCGYGRIGHIVVKEIMNEGHDVVVLEQDPELISVLEESNILCIHGDATNDKILLTAGLDKARSLISALSSEAANVYVTLTARQLNPDIQIISRASELSHITRLELAGADRVVMPHLIGGVRMAQSVLRPTVTNFLELSMRGRVELQMEELLVNQDSEVVDKDLIQSEIRPRFNTIIIGIKKRSGEMTFNPGPKEVIRADDTLLVVGKRDDLRLLREIL